MRRAPLVHEDLQPWIPTYESPRTAAVIEMDMGQQYVCHIPETNSDSIQAELERVETRCGTGIDKGDTAGTADDGGRDDVWTTAELDVNPGNAGREDGHARARHYTDRRSWSTRSSPLWRAS